MADDDTDRKKHLRPGNRGETVRQKVEKTAQKTDRRPRRLRTNTRRVTAPLRIVGRWLGKIGRYIIPPYFRQSWQELRQVTWPGKRESFRLTFAVIVFAVIFGGLVAIVDFGLDKIFKQVLLK